MGWMWSFVYRLLCMRTLYDAETYYWNHLCPIDAIYK